ncbi:MAG: HAD-IC family P-type ATPase, partial [Oscillospiraceae bacterium]|nr:HAD-IC family P-type ATPase [Oscillospiraceae bacterium]
TGDKQRTADAVGSRAGGDDEIAEALPGGKEDVIRELKKRGKTAMVGDGINDAPALTRADIGIAIGAGSDIALDAADVVLMKSRLSDVPAAIRLSRSTLLNIKENLFWAFIYNVIGIPLAAGIWIPLFGWRLNPMFGAAAMSLSSFCVVTNALRLNFTKIYSTAHDHKLRKKVNKSGKPLDNKEDITMEITMKIEGMMCAHCEAAVKKALEELPTVDSAEVSHEKGTAVVKLNAETDFAVLKKAVEDKDYKVVA